MTPKIDPRLIAIFSAAGWRRFIKALEALRNRGKPIVGSFSLADVTEDERRSYSRLLQLKNPPESGSLRYDLRRINAALGRQELVIDWLALLEAICGPPPAELLLNQENHRLWDEFWSWAEADASQRRFPKACDWLQALHKDGLLLRVSKGNPHVARDYYSRACHVLSHLPLTEEPLPSVAARLCGNSHALDPDSPLSSLLLRSLAMQRAVSMPSRSDDRRSLWEGFGIVCDDLSAPVLTFNLGLVGPALLCRLIAEAAAESQPLHLTNRMVAATDWCAVACPKEVFICENPTILSLASSRMGVLCPPMVCVNGEPRSTSRALLRRLREKGTALWYHGDFDWAGMSIASRMFYELGASPWLMYVSDYQEALSLDCHHALSGQPVETPWCPQLSQTMAENCKAVDEEVVADILIASMS